MKLSSIILLKSAYSKQDIIYSSLPYAIEFEDAVASANVNSSVNKTRWAHYAESSGTEAINALNAVTSITKTLAAGYRAYPAPIEAIESGSHVDVIRKLRTAIYTEHVLPIEGIDSGSVIHSISKRLVSYYIERDLTPEAVDSSNAVTLVNKKRVMYNGAFDDGINTGSSAFAVVKSRKYFDAEMPLEAIDATIGIESITKRVSTTAPPETVAILHFEMGVTTGVEAFLPFEDGAPEGSTEAMVQYGDGKLQFTNAAPQVGSITLRFEK